MRYKDNIIFSITKFFCFFFLKKLLNNQKMPDYMVL